MMYQKWIDMGLQKGLTDIEVFSVKNKSLKLTVYQQQVDQYSISDVEVAVIRGIYQGKLATVRIEDFSEDFVSDMLDELITHASALTTSEPHRIFEGSTSYVTLKDELFDFSSVLVKDKIDLLKSLEAHILAHPMTKQVQTSMYQEIESKTVIVNSKGLNLSRHHTYAYAYAIGVFGKADETKVAYDVKLVKSFDQFDVDHMAKTTIEKGVSQLGGTSIATKAYPAVFSNEMFSDIISVFSSIFSAEAAYRNLTQLKDKVGTKIAHEKFNLIDDPFHEMANFKVPFDDEGVACQKRHVIEKGVFTGFNHNLKTSAIFNESPTGHGFGGGISPTNLYLEPGTKTFDQLIEDIQEGIYITDLIGLHAGVKTVSGDFSLQAQGFKIKEGKIDHPVNMIVVSGNFFEIIKDIKHIANDLKFDTQGIGSPSVLVHSLMISGETNTL